MAPWAENGNIKKWRLADIDGFVFLVRILEFTSVWSRTFKSTAMRGKGGKKGGGKRDHLRSETWPIMCNNFPFIGR